MGSIGHPCRTIQGSALYVFDDCLSAEGGIYLCWGQANNPCSTVQALRGVYVFDQAVLLLPCWTNNYCQAWIESGNKTLLALLPTASIDRAFLVSGMQFSIGKMIKRRHNSITLCPIDRTDYHFRNRWA